MRGDNVKEYSADVLNNAEECGIGEVLVGVEGAKEHIVSR